MPTKILMALAVKAVLESVCVNTTVLPPTSRKRASSGTRGPDAQGLGRSPAAG
jgi:hypothetical protein